MIRLAFERVSRLILVALLALGLVTSASAHRMPVDPDQLAFVLATGASAADLCGGGPTEGALHPPCLACQIAASLVPPPVSALPVELRLAIGGPVLPDAPGRASGASRDRAHPPQAPPIA